MAKLLKEPGGVAAKVEALVKPVVEGLGLRLWDVRFEKEGGQFYLQILIDRDELMDTDTCEAASRAIDPVLDEADPISQSYFLEVGSPGLGRRLTRKAHFDSVMGQKVRVKLYAPGPDGRKEFAGLLAGLDEETIRLEEDGLEVALLLKDAAAASLCDDEDLF